MDKTLVLVKTTKGAEEIKTRASGLPQKLRTLLIMVDGQKSAGIMLERMGGTAEAASNLDELLAQGFIETVAEPAASDALTPQVAAAALAEVQREESYAEALSGLCRLMYEYLGPDADSFTGPLERAGTRDEFVKASERAAAAVRGLAGGKKADRVAERAAFILARYLSA